MNIESFIKEWKRDKMTILKKYIPQSWDEIVGQKEVITALRQYESIEDLPHLCLIGRPGIGKTACAYVLANTLGVTIKELNASDDRGIDVVRNEIKTLLFTAGKRIILLDEADNLTNDAQNALRRPMERALQTTNNRLILTVNREWKIIEPIISRCANFYFKPLSYESIKKIVLRVLKGEKVSFKTKAEALKVLNTIAKASGGDARKSLNLTEKVLTDKANIFPILEREVMEVDLAKETLNYAVQGEYEKTLRSLETLLLSYQVNNEKVIEVFYKGLENLDIEPVKKFILYRYLAEAERALKLQTSPLIQFTGFLMSIVAITHS